MDVLVCSIAGILSLCLVYPIYVNHADFARVFLSSGKSLRSILTAVQKFYQRIFQEAVLSYVYTSAPKTMESLNVPFDDMNTDSASSVELNPNFIDVQPPFSPRVSFDVDQDPTDAGMVNTSNFCFLNAILHCLFRSPNFLNALHRSMCARERHHPPNPKELCCWYLMETGFAMKEEKGGLVDVVKMGLTKAMHPVSTLINLLHQDQQDGEECLSFFLDILNDVTKHQDVECPDLSEHKEQIMEEIRESSSIHPQSYSHLVERLCELSWKEYTIRNQSFITHHFIGQIVRGSSCQECQHLSCHLQEMSVLSLGLHSASSAMSLESCLEHFKDVEDMNKENQVWCSKCQRKTNQRIQTLMSLVPSCLVIQLKRFTYLWSKSSKNCSPVYFPIHRLNLSPYHFHREGDIFYRLYAVCAHTGSNLSAGHYIAYCRLSTTNTTSAWLKYDDEVVSIVDEAQLLDETLRSAYLLFYERIP